MFTSNIVPLLNAQRNKQELIGNELNDRELEVGQK